MAIGDKVTIDGTPAVVVREVGTSEGVEVTVRLLPVTAKAAPRSTRRSARPKKNEDEESPFEPVPDPEPIDNESDPVYEPVPPGDSINPPDEK